MKIGFTVDEKCFNIISAEELINRATENNVKSIEISPDVDVLPANRYKKIIKLASDNSFEVNYHIPYFANKLYETNYFTNNKNESISAYEKFLSLVESFQHFLHNKPVIVVHGAKYTNQNEAPECLYATLSFIDWMLNTIESKNLNLNLGIETLGFKEERSIGDTRSDILYIVDNFKTEKLGICWDMCHDALNHYPENPQIDKSFLKNIVYSHIHGTDLSRKISHISLAKSNINYTNQIKSLIEAQYKGIVNLELLINYCGETYIDDLFKDIDYMNKLTKIM